MAISVAQCPDCCQNNRVEVSWRVNNREVMRIKSVSKQAHLRVMRPNGEEHGKSLVTFSSHGYTARLRSKHEPARRLKEYHQFGSACLTCMLFNSRNNIFLKKKKLNFPLLASVAIHVFVIATSFWKF